jgi:hypothetical protein
LVVLVRFAYLAVSNTFAALRLLPMSSRGKDAQILALRHHLRVLRRQLGSEPVRFERADRALLAALLGTLPRRTLRQLRLMMSPDTVLRWHRDLLNRRHAPRSSAPAENFVRAGQRCRTLARGASLATTA